jgi:3-hydroxyisobutyrate dehydrogenase
MGLLGSNFVRAMLERGDTVHVRNRTTERAQALEADGAVCFEDPAEEG